MSSLIDSKSKLESVTTSLVTTKLESVTTSLATTKLESVTTEGFVEEPTDPPSEPATKPPIGGSQVNTGKRLWSGRREGKINWLLL